MSNAKVKPLFSQKQRVLQSYQKIAFILMFSFCFGSFNLAMAQTDSTEDSTKITESDDDVKTTDGPEGSEISPTDRWEDDKKIGVGATMGQTLLGGDESRSKKGFNNALGYGVFFTYRFRERLNLALNYWSSSHDGIEKENGDLRRSHLTGELNYYFRRGIFSPYALLGAGIYSSDFRPSSMQRRNGVDSSTVQVFGVAAGLGIDFEIIPAFVLGVGWTHHHSFKREDSDRKVDEAIPFNNVNLKGTVYF